MYVNVYRSFLLGLFLRKREREKEEWRGKREVERDIGREVATLTLP